MADNDTMEIFYSTNADLATGEMRKGEFKDVMVRAAPSSQSTDGTETK